MEQTYLYDGVEVIFTGRVASKKITKGSRKTPTIDKLYEIEPCDNEDLRKWKKWVRLQELYLIHNDQEESDNESG